jgi:hypothetical protein
MKPIRTVSVMLVVAGLAASVAGAQKSLLVRLKWTPNKTDNQLFPVLDITGGLFTVRFDPMADKRNKGRQIGENTQGKTPVSIRTYDNVGTFLDKWITDKMRGLGLTITQDNPERVITLELIELWAIESTRYQCVIRVKVQVLTPDGKEIWAGVIAGNGENWGRSLKELNYQETISNAILDLIYTLATEPKFILSLKKQPL